MRIFPRRSPAATPSPWRRRRPFLIAGAALVVVVAGGAVIADASADPADTAGAPVAAAVSSSTVASSPTAVSTAAPTAPPAGAVNTTGFPRGTTGIFTDTCRRTTSAPNDPILMPNMPGASMQHDFFGNTTTNASSTTAQLIGKPTTCSTSADASAYWTPVLYQNGVALHPASTLIYWRASKDVVSQVQTLPPGLTMIAGNENASTPQGVDIVKWTCAGQTGPGTASPHNCPVGDDLRLVITFPSCWDGHTLNGAGQQNVVYPAADAKSACPTSHPIRIPQIVFHANYPTTSAGGLTLSIGPTQTGSITTEHADFMNGWNQSLFTADAKACINADIRCGQVHGDNATPRGGRATPTRVKSTPRRHTRTAITTTAPPTS